LTVEEVAQLLAGGAQPLVVDLREAEELTTGTIPGSLHIELEELAHRSAELPTDRLLICYCHSGVRSLFAAQALRAAGYKASSLAGGVLAWKERGLELDHPLADTDRRS